MPPRRWLNGAVYFGTSIPAFFIALDAETGKERFKFDARAPVFSSPAVAGGLACFGSFNGSLYAVNLKDGKLAWEFQTGAAKKNALGAIGADGKLDTRGRLHLQFLRGHVRRERETVLPRLDRLLARSRSTA